MPKPKTITLYLGIFGIFLLLCSCQTQKSTNYSKVKILVATKDGTGLELVEVKKLGEFNNLDYKHVKKALRLSEHLFSDLVFSNSPPAKLYWMDSPVFDGLTITPKSITNAGGSKYILIDKTFQITRESPGRWEYFKLAAILNHEFGHRERNMTEIEVKKYIDARFIQIMFFEPHRVESWNPALP